MKRFFSKRWLLRLMALGLVVGLPLSLVAVDQGWLPLIKEQKVTEEVTVKPPQKIKLVQTPIEGVRLAYADAQTLPFSDRFFTRYLWVRSGSMETVRANSLVCNYISRAGVIARPLPLAGNHLIRVDLRHYFAKEQDLLEALQIWEELAFDPTFSQLITKDTIGFLSRFGGDRTVRRRVRKEVKAGGPQRLEIRKVNHQGGYYTYPDDSGRSPKWAEAGAYDVKLYFNTFITRIEYGWENVPLSQLRLENVDVLRFNSVEPLTYATLQEQLGTEAPVVDARYFVARALTAIADEGVFKQLFGGLYYRFRGIKKAKEVFGNATKASDLDLFFENLGIGNIKAGLTAENLFDRLRSDQRMALFRSEVTGKPRDVLSFHTPADREGGAWGAITGDVKDADIDIGDRSYANLLTPRRRAREAIFPTAASVHIFALFNGEGALQTEVPPDIAIDTTIPAPYTRRLQPAIGCIRCHGGDGSDGWKPLHNDVKKLLAGGRLDILTDYGGLQRSNFDQYDVVNQLVTRFAGDFSKNFRRGRDDYAEYHLKAVGPWKDGEDQTQIGKLAALQIQSEYEDYFYTLVGAKEALYELGLDVPEEKSVKIFNALVPPDVERSNVGGVVYEDPRIGALRQGIKILRSDFALAFSFVYQRFIREAGRWQKQLGPKWYEQFNAN